MKKIEEKFPRLDKSKYKYCEKCDKILPLAHFKVMSVSKKRDKIYNETCILCDEKATVKKNKVPETMTILDSDGNVVLIDSDDISVNENPINVQLISPFEVFVQIEYTNTYWVSNYGRVVNNLRNPKKFFVHSKASHITINEIETDGGIFQRDYYIEELVTKYFLKKSYGRCRLIHIDGDKNNNYYKNLAYVNDKEYKGLLKGELNFEDLDIHQEYNEYANKARYKAHMIWNGIYTRCYKSDNDDNIHECYDEVTMCDEWKNNPRSFVDWYLVNYYSVHGETSMAVDKDLFSNGESKVYSSETCCILPQTINTMLTNCKKHKTSNTQIAEGEIELLPYCVDYNKKINKYYSRIMPFGHDETITLSYWDTPEEAFEEYKKIKEADITLMAAKYKNKIPERVYQALLDYEVKPY